MTVFKDEKFDQEDVLLLTIGENLYMNMND